MDTTPLTAEPGVYIITNTITGKCYIGSSVHMRNRWLRHQWELRNNRHASIALQRAWNKYGADAFTCTALETVSDKTVLRAREQHYMDTLQPAYNILPTAGTWMGAKHTDEARARMSQAQRGKSQRPEVAALHREQLQRLAADPTIQARIAEKLRGRVVTDATRALLSAANKGRKRSPEVCRALGERSRGRRASDEARARMSATRRGRTRTAEERAHISAGLQGHPVSEETRSKIRDAAIGRRHSAESRAKMSATRRGRPTSDEERARLREAALARWARVRAARAQAAEDNT